MSPVLFALERLIGAVLRRDPESLARVRALAGRVVVVETSPTAPAVAVRFHEHGVALERAPSGEHGDATVRAGLLDLLRAVADARRAELPDAVHVEGDAELVRELAGLAADIDIDWQGRLASVVGDGLAHHAGRLASDVRSAIGESGRTLRRNLAEYLTEERRVLVPRPLMDDFLEQVDILVADVDRLEQRLLRLEQRS